ncbi:MAG: protein BatD, partial [Gemmatimonadetes bacterium]|nr:protein BatD [Gemmatimonadota bacterium]MYH53272.1 protein BatD [Gemmatimonadota bacterium]
LPAPSHAQDIQVRAFLSAERVGWGGQFVLNVEVSGTQQTDADPVLPDMEEFGQYLGASTSTSMQVVNGRTSVALTYQYRFQAIKDGIFEIGPVKVTAGGRTYETEPVSLIVADTPAPQGGVADANEPAAGVSPEDLFVETDVSRTRVFENEPVVVEYRIFTRVPVEGSRITTLPQATGFWTEELEPSVEPQVEQVVRDGSQYATAVIRRAILFPTGAGERTVEPLGIEAQVRVPDRRRQGVFGDFFGGSGLFDRRVPVAVASRPVTIEVLSLPTEGRPGSFTGHVGEVDISATVDRPSVAANEAVTYRLDINGTGNLRALTPPEISFPDEFETFPPETSDDIAPGGGSIRGTRSYEYVLIPRAPGSVTIPPVEVSYFDAGARSYGTARSEPVAITVTGDAAAMSTETGTVPSAVESIREEIRFIHIGTPEFRRTGIPLHSTAGFWIVLLLPVAAVAGAAAVRRHRDRIEGDVAYARVRRARRMARKRLARAKGLAGGDPRDFYAEVAGALQGFLADKLNVAEAGLVREEAGGLARRRGVSDETLERLFACLDDCDLQRFAPAGTERETPDQVLERAAAIMGDLTKELSS